MDKLSSLNYKLPIKKKKKNRNLCLFILLCSLMFVTSLLLLVCSVLFIDNWKKAQNCLIYSTNYGNNSTFIIYLSIIKSENEQVKKKMILIFPKKD